MIKITDNISKLSSVAGKDPVDSYADLYWGIGLIFC